MAHTNGMLTQDRPKVPFNGLITIRLTASGAWFHSLEAEG